MHKITIIRFVLLIVSILTGNLFWYIFTNSLQTEPLLTNSPLRIAFSLLLPIIIFALYLPSILCYSFFEKSKTLLLIFIILSFASYPFIVGLSQLSIAGQLVISLSIYFFVEVYHKAKFLMNKKTSFIGQFSLSLTITTLTISIVIAINFYSTYKNILSQNNILISDKIFSTSLLPVTRAYLDDLQVTNISEKFGDYLLKRSNQTNEPIDKIRTKILFILGLPSVSDSETMGVLIETSLRKNIIHIFTTYRREIPVLISLGLGIITQTLLTVSTCLAGFIATSLLQFFVSMQLLHRRRELVEIDSIE